MVVLQEMGPFFLYFSFFLPFFLSLLSSSFFLPMSLTTSWFLSFDLRNAGRGEWYKLKFKVKWSRYRPGVAQRVGRGIALLFHSRGTRRGWVVSSTSRPHFTPGEDPVPILQEAGWAPGPVWTGGKSHLHRDSIPARLARSRSLYRLSYRAHIKWSAVHIIKQEKWYISLKIEMQ